MGSSYRRSSIGSRPRRPRGGSACASGARGRPERQRPQWCWTKRHGGWLEVGDCCWFPPEFPGILRGFIYSSAVCITLVCIFWLPGGEWRDDHDRLLTAEGFARSELTVYRVDQDGQCRVPWKVISRDTCLGKQPSRIWCVCVWVFWDEVIAGGLCYHSRAAGAPVSEDVPEFSVPWTAVPSIRRAGGVWNHLESSMNHEIMTNSAIPDRIWTWVPFHCSTT